MLRYVPGYSQMVCTRVIPEGLYPGTSRWYVPGYFHRVCTRVLPDGTRMYRGTHRWYVPGYSQSKYPTKRCLCRSGHHLHDRCRFLLLFPPSPPTTLCLCCTCRVVAFVRSSVPPVCMFVFMRARERDSVWGFGVFFFILLFLPVTRYLDARWREHYLRLPLHELERRGWCQAGCAVIGLRGVDGSGERGEGRRWEGGGGGYKHPVSVSAI